MGAEGSIILFRIRFQRNNISSYAFLHFKLIQNIFLIKELEFFFNVKLIDDGKKTYKKKHII